jgi:hypothetical protein
MTWSCVNGGVAPDEIPPLPELDDPLLSVTIGVGADGWPLAVCQGRSNKSAKQELDVSMMVSVAYSPAIHEDLTINLKGKTFIRSKTDSGLPLVRLSGLDGSDFVFCH